MFKIISTLLITFLAATPVYAEMVSILATRDTTLIEDSDGMLANGSGPALFVGRTGQAVDGIRRALIRFDVAAVLPENVLIDRVILSLHLNKSQAGQSDVSLHRLLDDWGEGTSFSSGGIGAPAEPGDSTWLHTFYDDQYWAHEGGHFIPHASATQVVGGVGFYDWQSTVNLVNDVRLWLHVPQHNFGWLVMGDEDSPEVKRFDSRESLEFGKHPVLTVVYHLPSK